jgi:hypothetical protein
MEKILQKINMGGEIRYVKICLINDPSPQYNQPGLSSIVELFNFISQNPSLICHEATPTSIKVFYDGKSWVLESLVQIKEGKVPL